MEQQKSPARRLRIFLRDFRMVEAAINLAEGQSLASFFATRKGYVNLREASWPGTNERLAHAALKVEQVLWITAGDSAPVAPSAAARAGRSIDVQLNGGLLLRARLGIGNQQRLSDYLEAAGRFLPLSDAQLLRSGRPPRNVNVRLGDIVLNQESIQAAWESVEQTTDDAPPDTDTAPGTQEERAEDARTWRADPPTE